MRYKHGFPYLAIELDYSFMVMKNVDKFIEIFIIMKLTKQ